ncbi:MAG TPA: hypothetical protein VMB78_02435, partial [Dissulfurispiraceae bacterium]|nr:hypothetical protein [Dissulfurispiraceae bacterium]
MLKYRADTHAQASSLIKSLKKMTASICAVSVSTAVFAGIVFGADLDDVRKRGVLRHLGVPYANFVTGSGDGMDVELMKMFARHIGVNYKYIKTDW